MLNPKCRKQQSGNQVGRNSAIWVIFILWVNFFERVHEGNIFGQNCIHIGHFFFKVYLQFGKIFWRIWAKKLNHLVALRPPDPPDRSSDAGPEVKDRSRLKLILRNPAFDLLHDGEHARVVVDRLAEGVRPHGRLIVILREKLIAIR